MGRQRGSGERARRERQREKLRVDQAQQKRAAAMIAAKARKKLPEKDDRKRRDRARTEPPLVVAAVPPALGVAAAAIAGGVSLWFASLLGLFLAFQTAPGVGGLLLALDLVGVPLLSLLWTSATFSRALRLVPERGARRWALAYHVVGKGGGAWLEVVRPRLVLSTARTLLVTTTFGPRLLPRFVRLESGDERELVLVDGAFTLEDAPERVRVEVEAEPERAVRVATPETGDDAARAAEPPACVECGEAVGDGRAECALCTDAVHDGACSARHAARHEGASPGRVYR